MEEKAQFKQIKMELITFNYLSRDKLGCGNNFRRYLVSSSTFLRSILILSVVFTFFFCWYFSFQIQFTILIFRGLGDGWWMINLKIFSCHLLVAVLATSVNCVFLFGHTNLVLFFIYCRRTIWFYFNLLFAQLHSHVERWQFQISNFNWNFVSRQLKKVFRQTRALLSSCSLLCPSFRGTWRDEERWKRKKG